MKILLVNPNSTASMTKKVEAAAKSVCAQTTTIAATNPTDAPASIEGHYDEVMSSKGLIEQIVWGEEQGFNGFLVACFDDPAIGACREVATGPVLGMCESAMIAASVVASRFSVVTTLARSVPIIEDLADHYGMSRRCRKVRATNLPVLALEDDGAGAYRQILQEVRQSIRQDRVEAVILGCAGMADMTQALSQETGIPVIDGVVAGVKLLEGLIGAGLSTSKVGAYAYPLKK